MNIIRNQDYSAAPSKAISDIMLEWFQLCKETGDVGPYYIGEGFSFKFNDVTYFLNPCTPWQGSGSYSPHINLIEQKLTDAGCTDVKWIYGSID